jgi:uncharacterized membrane protein
MLAALVALAGLFVASYLTLYKLGVIGTLSCSVGSCETVQLSRWATFLGLPVAVWGLGYYALVFTLALVGTHERFADSRGLSLALALLTGWGLIFSAWLTWLELFAIHAICQWCVVSAGLAGVLFIVCVLDWREAGKQFEVPSSKFQEGDDAAPSPLSRDADQPQLR